jgi:hypothetical protein
LVFWAISCLSSNQKPSPLPGKPIDCTDKTWAEVRSRGPSEWPGRLPSPKGTSPRPRHPRLAVIRDGDKVRGYIVGAPGGRRRCGQTSRAHRLEAASYPRNAATRHPGKQRSRKTRDLAAGTEREAQRRGSGLNRLQRRRRRRRPGTATQQRLPLDLPPRRQQRTEAAWPAGARRQRSPGHPSLI